ncbi:MAG: type II 3-dehydroquinate dehydratase [candidate division Zixibacteria bacterium]|jgi:3-dehydroquinate dehydratase-2|nr:type II 3-dehydroquinate dehydratase [candidate division Zixibacteria bacterium]
MKKVMIINGPNLNLLGTREPEVYGSDTLDQINESMKEAAIGLDLELSFYQSDIEGEIIELLHKAGRERDAVIINPAGYSHTSVAILDALKSISIPAVEVHLSNIYKREEFRQKSLTASGAWGLISGFGKLSYILALKALHGYFNEQ